MKKFIRSLKLVIIGLTLLILVTEITLRITCQKKLARWHAMEYVPDSIIGYRYKPNSIFLNSNIAYSNVCKTNRYGFPGIGFNIKKDNNSYRIIVVGTSDDTGFTSDGSISYAERLNNKFKKNRYNIEVINCSVDGKDRIVQNINLIRRELVNYTPDIILLRNQFPLKDILRYRETYKGHIINATKLADIDSTKKFIDKIYDSNNIIFKIYNISYIFRYYSKIYLDYKKTQPKHWFVTFSEKVFTYNNLNKLRMYVRNEIRYTPTEKQEFSIYLYEADPNWNEKTVTWNKCKYKNKEIKTFSSGTQVNEWLDIDITEYLKGKVRNKDKKASLLFYINPSKMRRIIFASKEWKSDSTGLFYPMLQISGKIKKTNQVGNSFPSSQYDIKASEDGYIRGGIHGDKNQKKDLTIQIKNGGNDESYSRKGLVKFDISNIESIEKASLKLFVIKIEFGVDMDPAIKKYSFSESLDTLHSLTSFLNKRNIKLVLFDTYKMESDTLKDFYDKNRINYLPLNVHFKNEYAFGEADGHSTQKGHEAIANALYSAFVNELFPKFNYPN